jgi:hypothetical protein
MSKYLVSRYSSPNEWHIEEVDDDYRLDDHGPFLICNTFTQAKAWLQDQTKAWVDGFMEDSVDIRALRKSDVKRAQAQDPA